MKIWPVTCQCMYIPLWSHYVHFQVNIPPGTDGDPTSPPTASEYRSSSEVIQTVGGAPPDHTHHTFGVPTIRSDLPAPRIKRVGDSKVCVYVCECIAIVQVNILMYTIIIYVHVYLYTCAYVVLMYIYMHVCIICTCASDMYYEGMN